MDNKVGEVRQHPEVPRHRRPGVITRWHARNQKPVREQMSSEGNKVPYIARSPILDSTQIIRQELDTMKIQDSPTQAVGEPIPQRKVTEFQPGDRLIGQHGHEVTIEKLLSQGADAVVYLTTEGQAVKVFRPPSESGSEGLGTPPEQEAAMMRLFADHPDILTVFGFDKTPDEIPFMVMEFAQGGSIRERIKREQIPPEEVLQILISTARALKAMHDAGLVHRDVKPHNILLTKTGAKLADFGIATVIGQTLENEFLGTPEYMAPERFRGEGENQLDDMYGLGASAFHMLTGELPLDFQGSRDLRFMYDVHHNQSIKSVAEILGDRKTRLHGILEGIVAKTLAKDPRYRYPDFGVLIRHLEAVRNVEQITIEMPFYQPLEGNTVSEGTVALGSSAKIGTEVKRHKKPNPLVTGVAEISGAVRVFLKKMIRSGDGR